MLQIFYNRPQMNNMFFTVKVIVPLLNDTVEDINALIPYFIKFKQS